MKKSTIGIVIVAMIATGAIGYAVKQQADIQEDNQALAEIELALAANERQQMQAQNLLFAYQLRLSGVNQRLNAIWQSVDGGYAAPLANLKARRLISQDRGYREMIEEQPERLYRLQIEHESLLKQKLRWLGQ